MASRDKLDLSVTALLALAESGVPADVQELLVSGNPGLGVKAGVLNALIDAVLKAKEERTNWELKELRDQNAAMKATIEAHESDQETLLGYVTAEEQLAFDPDDKWATSVFISDRQTDLFLYPVYRAPVTRNRILEGVQAICDSIPDEGRSAADVLYDLKVKIEAYKTNEQFDFEKTNIHIIEREDDALIAVQNLLVPSFMGLQAIARRPKNMSNSEWRPIAELIVDALRRKGPTKYNINTEGQK